MDCFLEKGKTTLILVSISKWMQIPYSPHGRSLEIPRGRGVLKVKILEAKYEAKLEFLRGRGWCKTKICPWGSMDIFWNCTMQLHC